MFYGNILMPSHSLMELEKIKGYQLFIPKHQEIIYIAKSFFKINILALKV
jgi:hypothetical protein